MLGVRRVVFLFLDRFILRLYYLVVNCNINFLKSFWLERSWFEDSRVRFYERVASFILDCGLRERREGTAMRAKRS